VGLVLAIASATSAATIYVDASATGQNSGENWTDAFNDLQDALAAAGAGDEIWVAAGTYKPTLRTDPLYPRTVTFMLVSGVKLYGGFLGTEATLEARGTDGLTTGSRLTRLSGDIGTVGTYTDNAYHVVTASGVNEETVLEGFVISDGYRTSSAMPSGAGLTCSSGSALRVNWCLFEYNRVVNNVGAAMGVDDSPVVVADCEFSNNVGYGGAAVGLWAASASQFEAEFSHCSFLENQANGGSGWGRGGAVYLSRMSASFEADCQFTGNVADYYGGAIYANEANLSVEDCLFRDNTATNNSGGAVFTSDNGVDRFVATRFIDNASDSLGGALRLMNDSCLFDRCQLIGNVSNNTASFSGGGVWVSSTTLTIWDSLFARNLATLGGALAVSSASGTPVHSIVNSTFVNNTARTTGGAWYSYVNYVPTIVNTISYGNVGLGFGTTLENNHFGYSATVSYSDVEGGVINGTGNISADPLFLDASNDNYRLGAGSPAREAGDNNAVPVGLTTDLDGDGRIVNTTVDMGAYEASPPVVVAAESIRNHTGVGELGLALSLLAPTSESRLGGPAKIKFSFSEDVVAGPNAVVSLSAGTLSSESVSGNEVTATVGSFTDQSCLEVTIVGYQDAWGYEMAPTTIQIRLLEGDGNNDGVVASSDITQVKLYASLEGEPATEANCRWDLNADGVIVNDPDVWTDDVDLVKARSGHSTSCP
jgi:predicted outer membrane repeat protein